MNVTELAAEANRLFHEGAANGTPDGTVYENVWRSVYNNHTGQSKRVLLHTAANLVFKWNPWNSMWGGYDQSWSERVVGSVNVEGKTYTVRLPYFEYVKFPENDSLVEIQEFVDGQFCECSTRPYDYNNRCPMPPLLREATNCNDTHCGNWKFCTDGTIVLFDFDGIRL